MQQFTRNLTREVEVGGERLAVTFSAEGLAVRPVGSRRPPLTMSWSALLCAAVGQSGDDSAPKTEAVAQALHQLKKPPRKKTEDSEKTPAESGDHAEKSAAPAEKPAASHPAAAEPAQSELASLLARIDHWFHEHRSRFTKALLPGASAEQLAAAEQQLGRHFPAELRTLLSWHNGQNSDVIGAFERSFFLMSATEVVEVCKDLQANPPQGWQRDWLPFLEDDADNYLVLGPGSSGGVREAWRGRTDYPVVAPSLTAWVRDFLEALEHGDYEEDPERGTFFRKGQ